MKAILKTLALSAFALSILVSRNAKAGTISIDNKTNQKIKVYANVIACGDGISFEVDSNSKKSRFTLCLLENVIIGDKAFSKGVKFGANFVITEKTIAGKKIIDIQTKEESEAQAAKEKLEAQKTSKNAIEKILSRIQQIKNKTNTAKTEKELNILSDDLEKLREEAFSFHVQNDNLLESYKANFASTSIAPDQAYAALQALGIVTAKENPYTMQTDTLHTRIKNRIDAEVKKGRQSQDPLLKELRQIDYIFRNDVSRKKYDNWLKNAPQVEISRDTLDKLLTQLVDVQSFLLEKIENVKKVVAQKPTPPIQQNLADKLAASHQAADKAKKSFNDAQTRLAAANKTNDTIAIGKAREATKRAQKELQYALDSLHQTALALQSAKTPTKPKEQVSKEQKQAQQELDAWKKMENDLEQWIKSN